MVELPGISFEFNNNGNNLRYNIRVWHAVWGVVSLPSSPLFRALGNSNHQAAHFNTLHKNCHFPNQIFKYWLLRANVSIHLWAYYAPTTQSAGNIKIVGFGCLARAEQHWSVLFLSDFTFSQVKKWGVSKFCDCDNNGNNSFCWLTFTKKRKHIDEYWHPSIQSNDMFYVRSRLGTCKYKNSMCTIISQRGK